ncbi:MAG TPA: DUF2240 family protein [Nanoarchaeota archaeon]|nr:MAG: replication factor A1 [archaeon GW2011_AR6]MBS3082565.1 DUF2240 family protein [Candidatus Pacearchaeota archaeon]HIH17474.1 DUF2240 family protein [Nanoarchaeota archaeon]HIH33943.1 DUF2240 family protein [Nanoarchaeota archaeon]HIH51766.1 DUF2240 family protein [Nanoarchaeota archaeon]
MMQARYKEFVIRVAKESGLSEEELEKRIKQKQISLGGLVSLEGASLIVASELGIKFDAQRVKVSGLMVGMRNVDILGKITRIYPVKTYKQKDGKEGKIGSFILADDTGSVRVVLWDTMHTALLEEKRLEEGNVIFLKKADVRGTDMKELHLGGKSSIEHSDEVIENVRTSPSSASSSKISEFRDGERTSLRATIVQAFPLKFFPSCPECKKRVTESDGKYYCLVHKEVKEKFLPIINLYIDDGTASVRAIGFLDAVRKLYNLREDEVSDLRSNAVQEEELREKLLGEEFMFDGRVRKNAMMDRIEFVINSANAVDIVALIDELSKATGLE